MYKPASLRQHLAAQVPALQRDPDQLSILVRSGHIVSAGESSLGFEYQYTLQLVVLDYGAHADALMVPMLVWLRTHQPEYFENPDLRDKGFRFDAEFNGSTTIDLLIELDLTERVQVTPKENEAGAFTIEHLGEPQDRWAYNPGDQAPPLAT